MDSTISARRAQAPRARMLHPVFVGARGLLERWDSPSRRWILGACISVLVLAAAIGGSFLWGDTHALDVMRIERASPAQLGNDMQKDDFYSQYREATILLTATVSSVEREGRSQIATFASRSAYVVQCSMQKPLPTLRAGQRITVIAEGEEAVRGPHGVLLEGCLAP